MTAFATWRAVGSGPSGASAAPSRPDGGPSRGDGWDQHAISHGPSIPLDGGMEPSGKAKKAYGNGSAARRGTGATRGSRARGTPAGRGAPIARKTGRGDEAALHHVIQGVQGEVQKSCSPDDRRQ